MMWHWGFDGWGWLMMLIPTLMWAGLIGLGVWALVSRSPSPPREQDALDILQGRYARGDIGREEYMERRHDLLH
jgi:putative membrane protein